MPTICLPLFVFRPFSTKTAVLFSCFKFSEFRKAGSSVVFSRGFVSEKNGDQLFLIYNMVANFRFFCFLTRIFPQNRQLRTPLRHRFQMSFRSLFRQRFNPLFAVCFFSFSSFEKPLSKNFRNACCITSVTPPFRDVFRSLFSLRNIAPKRCINMVLTVV